MTRSFSGFLLAEGLAAVGICFGVWLIHAAFLPGFDAPQPALTTLGGLDILLCCCGLGYTLRLRLQDGQRVPKSWIILGVILIAGFLGWISALLMDAERLRHDRSLREQSDQHLVKMEDAVRQLQHLLPPLGMGGAVFDRQRWDLVHDHYVREHDHLHTLLRERDDWAKQVTQIHEHMQHVHQSATTAAGDPRNDALLTRDHAQMQLEKLHQEINHGKQDAIVLLSARWHSLGAAALSGVFLMLGCLLPWLVFDRQLRRRRRAQTRLGIAEAHFRCLVEKQPDPIAVVDASANIVYINSAWQDVFGYQPEDVQGRVFFELIHPEDRPRVQLAYEQQQFEETVSCRLSADYGVWHDVEMRLQEHQEETTAVRFHHLRETGAKSAEPSVPTSPGTLQAHDIPALVYLYDPALRRFTAASNFPLQLLGYDQAAMASATDFLMSLVHPEDEARVFRPLVLRGDNRQMADVEEEIRLRDASGQYQWFAVRHRQKGNLFSGVAFPIERQKRAEEARTEAERKLHAATESERQARAELARLQEQQKSHDENLREHEHRRKHLEKSLREREGHYEKLKSEHDEHKKLHEGKWRDHEHHRKHLEKSLREREEDHERLKSEHEKLRSDHEEHKKLHEDKLRDHEHHRKHLEKSLREREEACKKLEDELREREGQCRKWEDHARTEGRRHEDLEATLRDQQDRLHEAHTSHERHARSLQSSKEASRRLASGVANDFNKILSVVLGYTDVLRESFPKDHLAQNYVDEIRQAASHGAELSQKLLAFSRNHLLQLVPFELNHFLAGLEGKIRDALGHGVQWQWNRGEQDLWIKTDPHPMEQTLLHLLTHLRQRLLHGGTLSMETSLVTLKTNELTHADMSPGSYVRLNLHDPANDLDEEARNHFFEPYYAAGEGHKRDLSLATANGIIRQSGGCIDVESVPGQGSTISIFLPRTDERPHTTAEVA